MTWRQMSPRTPLFLLQATIGPPRRCALQDSRQYALKPRTTDAARSRPLRAPARNSGTTLPPSEALRSIRLPEDKKGRKALLEATTLWKEQREKDGRTALQLHRTLTLAIDDRPTTQKSLITDHGIIFAKDNDFGERLWRIANAVPWAKRSRAVRWPVYGLAGYHCTLLFIWIVFHEQEPITGRWRFNCVPAWLMACLKHGDRVHTIDRIEELTIPYDHKITQAIESVLARLSAAAGLDHVDWQVYFVKSPCKSICPFSKIFLLTNKPSGMPWYRPTGRSLFPTDFLQPSTMKTSSLQFWHMKWHT